MREDTVKGVQAYNWGQSRVPLLEFDQEIREVHGHADHMATLEETLIEILKSDASPAAKRYCCQRLGLIGRELCVPTLVGMFSNAQNAELARYALERIPTKTAGQALRDALPKTKGNTKIGIIHSLGVRKDEESVSQLGELLGDSNSQLACAAAWALGQIGSAGAGAQLASAKDSTNDNAKLAILDARLACAERLQSEGKLSDAAAIYNELKTEGMPKTIRRAAERALTTAKV